MLGVQKRKIYEPRKSGAVWTHKIFIKVFLDTVFVLLRWFNKRAAWQLCLCETEKNWEMCVWTRRDHISRWLLIVTRSEAKPSSSSSTKRTRTDSVQKVCGGIWQNFGCPANCKGLKKIWKLNLRLQDCLDEKKSLKQKRKSTPKLCWADKVKLEFWGRFGGKKGQKRKIA